MRWLVSAAFAASLLPRPADACSPNPCVGKGELVPTGTIPANLDALLWTPNGRYDPDSTSVRLIDEVTGREVPLDIAPGEPPLRVRLREALLPGSRYVMTATTACPRAWSRTVEAEPASPLPTALGALRVSIREVERRGSDGGACGNPVDAARFPVAELGVTFDPSALPWRNALVYETLVDGAPRPGTKAMFDCDAPAVHRFRLRASLTNGVFVGETDEVETEVRCGGCACVAVPQSSLTVAALFVASLLLRRRSCAHAHRAGDRSKPRAR